MKILFLSVILCQMLVTANGQNPVNQLGSREFNRIINDRDGTYLANVKGELTIKGITKPVSEKGTIKVTGNKIEVQSKFNILLADYGITFTKGKTASSIAKTLELNVQAVYELK